MVEQNSNRYYPRSANGTNVEVSASAVFFDDDGPADEDAAGTAARTILITALAGALTAATVLCGWGLQIGADERAGRQVGGAARDLRGLVVPERAFFQAGLVDESPDGIASGLLPGFTGVWLPRQTVMAVEQAGELGNAALRASEYARERSRLERYLARLAELARGQSAGATAAVEIQNRAEYEALLMQADILRRKLQEMRAADGRFGASVSATPEPAAEAAEAAVAAVAGPAALPERKFVIETADGRAESLAGEGSAAAHCRKLLANLELNRRSTIAELAFVDEGEEFWRD